MSYRLVVVVGRGGRGGGGGQTKAVTKNVIKIEFYFVR